MTEAYVVRASMAGHTGEYVPGHGESVRGNAMQIRKSSGRRTDSVFVPPLAALAMRLSQLLTWPEEWDGYQVAPSHDAVANAFQWIKGLYEDASRADEWIDPLIVADAHGNVVFEWLNDNKRLVVHVSPETVEYLKTWGPDIWSDMEDGEAETPEERWTLW